MNSSVTNNRRVDRHEEGCPRAWQIWSCAGMATSFRRFCVSGEFTSWPGIHDDLAPDLRNGVL